MSVCNHTHPSVCCKPPLTILDTMQLLCTCYLVIVRIISNSITKTVFWSRLVESVDMEPSDREGLASYSEQLKQRITLESLRKLVWSVGWSETVWCNSYSSTWDIPPPIPTPGPGHLAYHTCLLSWLKYYWVLISFLQDRFINHWLCVPHNVGHMVEIPWSQLSFTGKAPTLI